jgi:hypothetical protein
MTTNSHDPQTLILYHSAALGCLHFIAVKWVIVQYANVPESRRLWIRALEIDDKACIVLHQLTNDGQDQTNWFRL